MQGALKKGPTRRCSSSMCSSRICSTRLRMPMRLSIAALSDSSALMRPLSSSTLPSSSLTLLCAHTRRAHQIARHDQGADCEACLRQSAVWLYIGC